MINKELKVQKPGCGVCAAGHFPVIRKEQHMTHRKVWSANGSVLAAANSKAGRR